MAKWRYIARLNEPLDYCRPLWHSKTNCIACDYCVRRLSYWENAASLLLFRKWSIHQREKEKISYGHDLLAYCLQLVLLSNVENEITSNWLFVFSKYIVVPTANSNCSWNKLSLSRWIGKLHLAIERLSQVMLPCVINSSDDDQTRARKRPLYSRVSEWVFYITSQYVIVTWENNNNKNRLILKPISKF